MQNPFHKYMWNHRLCVGAVPCRIHLTSIWIAAFFPTGNPKPAEKLGMCFLVGGILVLAFILLILIAEYICYDDACHLKKHSINATRQHLTQQSEKLASVNMVVDKMHMAGHVDKWCKKHCDAKSFKELDKVRIIQLSIALFTLPS